MTDLDRIAQVTYKAGLNHWWHDGVAAILEWADARTELEEDDREYVLMLAIWAMAGKIDRGSVLGLETIGRTYLTLVREAELVGRQALADALSTGSDLDA